MSASKKRSAADFLPASPPSEPLVPVAEALAAAATDPVVDEVAELEPTSPGDVETDPAVLAEMMKELKMLRAEVSNLRQQTDRVIEETSDLTDDLWFISRPNGKKNFVKAILNGRRVMVEDVRTSFVGPFDSEEDVRIYLATKALKRPDSVIDWSTCSVMLGRDAREIERRETRNFERQYGSNPEAAVNILERRVRPMFDNQTSQQKAAMGLSKGEGKATNPVPLPRVFVKKLADGTETLDIRE